MRHYRERGKAFNRRIQKRAFLAQKRTGKSRLKSYLHAFGAEDSFLCECNCGKRDSKKCVARLQALADGEVGANGRGEGLGIDGATCPSCGEDGRG